MVLLQEVRGVLDRPWRGAPDRRGEALADRERQDRVGVGPQHQRRAAVLAQRLEHPLPGGGAGRVGRLRDQQREGARAGLRGGVRERRVVGGDHLVAGVVLAGAAHEHADRQVLGARDEVAEGQPRVGHPLVPGEQAGVEDHEALDPLRVLDGESQPDRAAPVVHDDRRAAQVEILEQRRRHRDVAVVGVPVDVGRLVRAPEAGEIGRQAAKAGVAHRRDHLAPQKRPGGLAVHEDHGRPVALVEVGQAQAVHLAVVRGEREVREPLQRLLGRAHRVGHLVLGA